MRGGRARSRRSAALACAAVLVLGAAGCGSPSPDLFELVRSGEDPNANVEMLVNDGGTVTCNGRSHPLDSERLVTARGLARDLADHAALGIELEPEPGSVLRYRVRTEAGTVAFADNSRGRPEAFDRLVAFATDTIRSVCGIQRA